jgi:hypothetical protein
MNPQSYAILFSIKAPNYAMEKKQPLQQMLLGKVFICWQKTETRSMFITLCLYQLKMDQGP